MNPKLIHIPKHQRDRMVGATLADNLRQQYSRRSVRVVKGDSVRVMRGEYKGVEGKVEKVNTENGTLQIEGVQREKIKGGQVKVFIHASNVMVTSLKTDDKYRSAMLSGQKTTAAKAEKPAAAAEEPKAEKKPKAAAKKAPAAKEAKKKKAKPAKKAKAATKKTKAKKKEATS